MKNFKRLRMQRKLSQGEVADLLGVSPSTVASWEAGKFWPSVPNLLELANIFGVSTDFLLDRRKRQNAEPQFAGPQTEYVQ